MFSGTAHYKKRNQVASLFARICLPGLQSHFQNQIDMMETVHNIDSALPTNPSSDACAFATSSTNYYVNCPINKF